MASDQRKWSRRRRRQLRQEHAADGRGKQSRGARVVARGARVVEVTARAQWNVNAAASVEECERWQQWEWQQRRCQRASWP